MIIVVKKYAGEYERFELRWQWPFRPGKGLAFSGQV